MNRLVPSLLRLLLLPALCAAAIPAQAALVIVDFGTGNASNLPYVEDDFSFSLLSGGGIVAGPSGDRYLTVNLPVGATTSGLRIASTANERFDLLSFDLGFMARDWKVIASSGAIRTIPHGSAAGGVSFAPSADWQNLTFVDIVHEAGQANAYITLDDFNFVSPTLVPEPSAFLVFAGVGLGTLLATRRRRRR